MINLTLSLAIFDQHGNFYSLLISSLGKNGVTLLKLNQYLSEHCCTAYYSLCGYSNRRSCLALPCNNISVPKEKYDTQGEKKVRYHFFNCLFILKNWRLGNVQQLSDWPPCKETSLQIVRTLFLGPRPCCFFPHHPCAVQFVLSFLF